MIVDPPSVRAPARALIAVVLPGAGGRDRKLQPGAPGCQRAHHCCLRGIEGDPVDGKFPAVPCRPQTLENLAVAVAVAVLGAVGERDATVVDAERRAGQALCEMTEDEGLSVGEAVEWCGDETSTWEARWLRRLARHRRRGPARSGPTAEVRVG